jgi:nicotinamide-nucleotide amidase
MSTDQPDLPDDIEVSEEAIGTRLSERGETLAVAESLTGGLICSRLTDIPGASDYFDRGLVAYSNDAKQTELGVSRESLDADGAVSESVAGEMARGIRDTAGTTWGVSTTGIAGPTGGTPEKPVGLVYIGVAYAGPWGSESSFTRVDRHVFDGDRLAVTQQSATQALVALGDALETVEPVQE